MRCTVYCLQDGKIYSFEELSDSSAALLSQRHSQIRDVGKEIGKLLSSSNRILKVGHPRNHFAVAQTQRCQYMPLSSPEVHIDPRANLGACHHRPSFEAPTNLPPVLVLCRPARPQLPGGRM